MKAIRIVALGAAVALGLGASGELRAQASPAPQAGAERAAKARAERGERGERGRMHGRHMGGLFRDIELTEAQKEQMKAIHERYRPQMQALRPDRGEGRDSTARPDSATRAQALALMTRRNAELRAVLTAEQQAPFDRNVTQMKERGARKGGKHGKREGRRGERAGR